MLTKLFKYNSLACLFLMINCSNLKLEDNRLVGHWTGKIPETSAELYFNKDGKGSIFYSNFDTILKSV